MSLSRLFLRLATVRALSGATLAEGRVFDSDIPPLDQRLSSEMRPVISVYTDDHEDNPTGRASEGDGGVDLVIEIAVAGIITIEGDVGGVTTQVAFGETDAGLEFTLDLLERQIFSSLTASESLWAVMWRTICVKITRRLSRRGAAADSGTRFAARQITLTCETLIEPPPGIVYGAETGWGKLLAAIEATPALAPVAPILRGELDGQGVSDWRAAARVLGINLDIEIGLGGFTGDDPEPLIEGDVVPTAFASGPEPSQP